MTGEKKEKEEKEGMGNRAAEAKRIRASVELCTFHLQFLFKKNSGKILQGH